jgi:predicted metallo-beta-lactamase superfamily hydrolase
MRDKDNNLMILHPDGTIAHHVDQKWVYTDVEGSLKQRQEDKFVSVPSTASFRENRKGELEIIRLDGISLKLDTNHARRFQFERSL